MYPALNLYRGSMNGTFKPQYEVLNMVLLKISPEPNNEPNQDSLFSNYSRKRNPSAYYHLKKSGKTTRTKR